MESHYEALLEIGPYALDWEQHARAIWARAATGCVLRGMGGVRGYGLQASIYNPAVS
jgi:hypothetical protein